jgi:hypothetical protein
MLLSVRHVIHAVKEVGKEADVDVETLSARTRLCCYSGVGISML